MDRYTVALHVRRRLRRRVRMTMCRACRLQTVRPRMSVRIIRYTSMTDQVARAELTARILIQGSRGPGTDTRSRQISALLEP